MLFVRNATAIRQIFCEMLCENIFSDLTLPVCLDSERSQHISDQSEHTSAQPITGHIYLHAYNRFKENLSFSSVDLCVYVYIFAILKVVSAIF